MKQNLNKLSVFIKTTLCTSLLCLATPSYGAKEKAPRWFEIEVILFKQLGDKKLLKEQFPDEVMKPSAKRSFDLLSDFLQPDIKSLKQKLPFCQELNSSEKFYKSDFIAQARNTDFVLYQSQAQFSTKSLTEIEAMPVNAELNLALIENGQAELAAEQDITNSNNFNNAVSESLQQENQEVHSNESREVTDENIDSTTIVDNNVNADNIANLNVEAEQLTGLTEEQIQLLELAEQEFSLIQYKNYSYYPKQPKNTLCQIPESFFKQTLSPEQLASFNSTAFNVETMPQKIAASGVRKTHTPYLISKDSLRLNDVTQRLRWSKNFKPLVHLGWRQIGVTRNKAIPMQLFAGKHLAYEYQQQLKGYQEYVNQISASEINEQQVNALIAQFAQSYPAEHIDALQNVELSESESNKQINSLINSTDEATNTQQNTEGNSELIIKQQYINAIINQASLIKSDNTDYVISQLGQPIELLAQNNDDGLTNVTPEALEVAIMPEPPMQNWELDGLFKVHLDHYLYITADFNLVTKDVNSNSQGTEHLDERSKSKQISFQQNRRVISGEVHYFDHPYIGMLVQIRRFDPNKSGDDAVSQAIK
ncbi:CsiV family protein [Litorilituus lipolyticus]|uniref:Uncharacterized protein n=1 Tax=Litorilituus lipolyticus TaxID=2491017 RepID=A0A502KWF1_9GAMM|nr:CsiV family protein [Litorilituus lipolyticus]TPH15962.1 hypothetical protein EPA86_07595 [Litorilituus lipolyticus]